MTIRVDAEELGEEFVELCEAILRGEEVYFVKDGVRLAQLVPHDSSVLRLAVGDA
jgi:antitoxin (DNA-binding transcriptional repressor) of toxin-antitoxin stability system